MSERNMKIKEAALLMDRSPQFVRIGLQRNILPFGTAIKMSSKWTYHIPPERFYQYMGKAKTQVNI